MASREQFMHTYTYKGISRDRCKVLLLALSLAGCADKVPQRVPLHGQVTYSGEPVADGIVSLLPAGGGEVSVSTPIESGRYAFTEEHGPPPGDYRLEIEGFRKTGRKIPDLVTPAPAGQPPATIDEKTPFIPPKHNSDSTTTVSVSPDKPQLDFQLKP